jgi:hypothetical protein
LKGAAPPDRCCSRTLSEARYRIRNLKKALLAPGNFAWPPAIRCMAAFSRSIPRGFANSKEPIAYRSTWLERALRPQKFACAQDHSGFILLISSSRATSAAAWRPLSVRGSFIAMDVRRRPPRQRCLHGTNARQNRLIFAGLPNSPPSRTDICGSANASPRKRWRSTD